MTDAVAKPAPKKKPARKSKAAKATIDPAAGKLLEDAPTGLEVLHDACETLRGFVRSSLAWEIEADALEAMAAVGLLQRVVFRLEGRWDQLLTTDAECELSAALEKLIRRRR